MNILKRLAFCIIVVLGIILWIPWVVIITLSQLPVWILTGKNIGHLVFEYLGWILEGEIFGYTVLHWNYQENDDLI